MVAPQTQERPGGRNGNGAVIGVCVLLVVAVGLVFGQTVRYEFVNLDDDVYVYANPQVAQGLTLPGIAWAFTTSHSAYWHPLTWLSHMLDCQLWGLNAGGHHLTNVVLHAANAVLLFLVLRQMTRALWLSAFVAAVFAIHPLNVESVAWVAQRKNVLSTLFWLLTMGAYLGYVRKPGWRRYVLVVICCVLGLMSKPMLVTLPFVLLLLDYWPLHRFEPSTLNSQLSTIRRLIAEKLPLLLLAVVSSVVTYLGQKSEGAVIPLEQSPLGVRLAKVPVNYVIYLRNTLWPEGLATPYPYPSVYPVFLVVVLCTLLLAGVTLLVLWVARTKPYAAVGWFWFLGTLVPVIGLIQVGNTPVADRFTYVPQIGLYLVVAWAIRDLTVSWRYRRQVLWGAALGVIAALMICAWKQTSYWRDSESLWTHTLVCMPDNCIGHNGLGNALLQKGNVDEAIVHYQKALQITPDFAKAHNNLGTALLQKGSVDEAIVHYQKALQITPDFAKAHNGLGNALLQKGNVDEAIIHYQKALQITPDYAEACCNLGTALLQKGSVDEAIVHYQKALQITPDYAEAHNNLGNALLQKGNVDEAIDHFKQALKITPDSANYHYNLGNALLQVGQLDEAINHFKQALEIEPNYVMARNNLGVALMRSGQLDAAIMQYQQALELAPDYAEAYYNWGLALGLQGKLDEAITHYQKAIDLKPDYAEAHYDLGAVFGVRGRLDEAIEQYQKAIAIKPDYADAHGNLANVLAAQGKLDEAIKEYQRTLELMPNSAQAHFRFGQALQTLHNFAAAKTEYQKVLELDPKRLSAHLSLAWLLATCPEASIRNGAKAVALTQQAERLGGGESPQILDTLAAAYAEAGRYPEAVETAKRALNLTATQNNKPLAQSIQSRLKLYETNASFHEKP